MLCPDSSWNSFLRLCRGKLRLLRSTMLDSPPTATLPIISSGTMVCMCTSVCMHVCVCMYVQRHPYCPKDSWKMGSYSQSLSLRQQNLIPEESKFWTKLKCLIRVTKMASVRYKFISANTLQHLPKITNTQFESGVIYCSFSLCTQLSPTLKLTRFWVFSAVNFVSSLAAGIAATSLQESAVWGVVHMRRPLKAGGSKMLLHRSQGT